MRVSECEHPENSTVGVMALALPLTVPRPQIMAFDDSLCLAVPTPVGSTAQEATFPRRL